MTDKLRLHDIEGVVLIYLIQIDLNSLTNKTALLLRRTLHTPNGSHGTICTEL